MAGSSRARRFPAVFGTAGVTLIVGGLYSGGISLVALWPGLNFLLLAVIYGLDRPRWLGKRDDGRMSPAHVVVLFPFFGFIWTMWRLFSAITPEPASHEVAPGIHLGRRPLPGRLPAGVDLIIDLTAEFPSYRAAGVEVIGAWSLDAKAPPASDLDRVVARAAGHPGAVLIHCAAGHGRSALVAALVLIRRGLAPDLESAELALKAVRPEVRLHGAQRIAGDAALVRESVRRR